MQGALAGSEVHPVEERGVVAHALMTSPSRFCDDRKDILGELRQTIRNTRSLGSMDAVQFLIDGKLVDDIEFRVRIETSEGGVYLDVGQLFVEEPRPVRELGATHAVARK